MSIVALVTDKSGVLPHWQAQVSAHSAGLAPTTARRVCECGNARVCCLCVDSEKCHSIVRLDHCTLHSYIWIQKVDSDKCTWSGSSTCSACSAGTFTQSIGKCTALILKSLEQLQDCRQDWDTRQNHVGKASNFCTVGHSLEKHMFCKIQPDCDVLDTNYRMHWNLAFYFMIHREQSFSMLSGCRGFCLHEMFCRAIQSIRYFDPAIKSAVQLSIKVY